jgi:transcriptional regulator NrdR family protein
MLCTKCDGSTRVADSRGPHSRYDPSLLCLQCPDRISEKTSIWRLRKRKCLECGHTYLTIELPLSELETE